MNKTDKKIEDILQLPESECIYALNELIEEYNFDCPEAIKELKEILKTYNYGNIGLAQINPILGNIQYNAQKIVKRIKYAENLGLDMVVFPELTLTGYPIDDIIDRHPVVVEENIKWIKEIAKITGKTRALVGFIEKVKSNTGRRYYNAAAVLGEGKIESIVRKTLLPNYSEFYDARYFEPSPIVGAQPPETLCNFQKPVDYPKLNIINGKKYGITICEDCWNNNEFFIPNLYHSDPVKTLADEFPDVIINCSASPTRTKKEQLKHNMLSYISRMHKTPFVYVNQVGAIDNNSFDGSSRVYNARGELLARAKSFEEQFLIVNPIKGLGNSAKFTRLQTDSKKHYKNQKFLRLIMNRI